MSDHGVMNLRSDKHPMLYNRAVHEMKERSFFQLLGENWTIVSATIDERGTIIEARRVALVTIEQL